MSKTLIPLVLTSAVVIADGAVARAGTRVEVEELVARNLLDRRKAVLDGDVKLPEASATSGGQDGPTDADIQARAMKDQEMDLAAWEALSPAKRKACLKAARAAIEAE